MVGDALDVGLGYGVDAVHGAEEFFPIAVARLINGELRGEPGIVRQPANQVGLGPRLDHLKFFVPENFLSSEFFDFFVNRLSYFIGRVSGQRDRVEREQVRILVSGSSGKAG